MSENLKETAAPKNPADILAIARYAENCLTWVRWYAIGDTNKREALDSLETLSEHCEQLKKLIQANGE